MFQAKHINTNQKLTTEEIISAAVNVADDSYDSVIRSLKIIEQTRIIGAESLDKLNDQCNKIKNTQIHLDNIDYLQNKADRNMSAINSIGGVVTNKFIPESKTHDNVKKGNKKVRSQLKKEKQKKSSNRGGSSRILELVGLRKQNNLPDVKITNVYQADLSMLPEKTQETIHKTDHVIDQIGAILDDLKMLSMEMGDEITSQNTRLDIMKPELTKANVRMKKTNAKIHKQI